MRQRDLPECSRCDLADTSLPACPQARNDSLSEKPRGDGPSRFAFQKLDTAATKARAIESLVSFVSRTVARKSPDIYHHFGTAELNEPRVPIGETEAREYRCVRVRRSEVLDAGCQRGEPELFVSPSD